MRRVYSLISRSLILQPLTASRFLQEEKDQPPPRPHHQLAKMMSRCCSEYGTNGHKSRTCAAVVGGDGSCGGGSGGEIMLFGVRVKVDPMRKSVSMNNLSQYEQPQQESSNVVEVAAAGYSSADDAVRHQSFGNRERKRDKSKPRLVGKVKLQDEKAQPLIGRSTMACKRRAKKLNRCHRCASHTCMSKHCKERNQLMSEDQMIYLDIIKGRVNAEALRHLSITKTEDYLNLEVKSLAQLCNR